MKGRAYTFKLNLVQLHFYARPFVHCFYFIDARKIFTKIRDSRIPPLLMVGVTCQSPMSLWTCC